MDREGRPPVTRPVTLRDLWLVQRLQRHGLVLDYESAGVDGVSPMRDALSGCLPFSPPHRRTLVLVGRRAFVQYASVAAGKRARLSFIAPAPLDDERADRWLDLMESLVAAAGAQGVHHIVAEARDDGPELVLLQQAGFGIFTRQQLYRLLPDAVPTTSMAPLAGLRFWRATDEWGLRLLYTNTVPQMVQHIEPPADSFFSRWPSRLVLEHDGELVAVLAARQGRAGNALRLILHPQADAHAQALIHHGLMTLLGRPKRPIYCRVRRYESWLCAPLQACGFELVAQTALLVKHTVGRVMSPAWERTGAIEGRVEMTSPVAHTRLGRPN